MVTIAKNFEGSGWRYGGGVGVMNCVYGVRRVWRRCWRRGGGGARAYMSFSLLYKFLHFELVCWNVKGKATSGDLDEEIYLLFHSGIRNTTSLRKTSFVEIHEKIYMAFNMPP